MADSVMVFERTSSRKDAIAQVAGPLLLSMLLNVGVYGVLCGQTYLYHISFQTDKPRLKWLVSIVFILETIQTALNLETLYREFVYGFLSDRHSSLDHIGNLWFVVPILGGVVALISQTFYAHRIVILGQQFGKVANVAAGLIGLLAFGQMVGAIAIGIEMIRAQQFSLFVDPKVKLTVVFWNGGSALCDITIAVCMTYILFRSSDREMKKTRQLVEKLVRLMLGTGTVTACVALLNIILTMLPGEPTYYQASATVLSKLYANSILVVLNSRIRFTPESYEGSRSLSHSYVLTTSGDMEFVTRIEIVD